MYTYVFMFAIHRKLAQGQHFWKKGHMYVSGSLYKALQLCLVNCRFMTIIMTKTVLVTVFAMESSIYSSKVLVLFYWI